MHTTRNKSERPRRKNDFYPTPYGLAHDSLEELYMTEPTLSGKIDHILDAGCGAGIWMDAAQEIASKVGRTVTLTGIDLEPTAMLKRVIQGDFLTYEVPTFRYDLVMGNPPYNQMEPFVRHALESDLLSGRGMVFFLCRLEFLASKSRMYGLFKDHPLHRVYILSRRPSFFSTNGHRTTDAQDYAMFLWKKYPDDKPTEMHWLYWNYHPIHDVITEIDAGPQKPEDDTELLKTIEAHLQQGELDFYSHTNTTHEELTSLIAENLLDSVYVEGLGWVKK